MPVLRSVLCPRTQPGTSMKQEEAPKSEQVFKKIKVEIFRDKEGPPGAYISSKPDTVDLAT